MSFALTYPIDFLGTQQARYKKLRLENNKPLKNVFPRTLMSGNNTKNNSKNDSSTIADEAPGCAECSLSGEPGASRGPRAALRQGT